MRLFRFFAKRSALLLPTFLIEVACSAGFEEGGPPIDAVRVAASDRGSPYRGAGSIVGPFGYGRLEQVIAYAPMAGRTGQWWCDNHFAKNLGGDWKCRGVSGAGSCGATVAGGELVSCSQYADVQSISVYAPLSGRTGQWWCDNHFAKNLGGSWDCLRVSGGRCSDDAGRGVPVTCGRYEAVDETPFSPPSCDAATLDSAEIEFCRYTEYMTTRKTGTLYLYNDFVRAGFSRSFGGTLFELYGSDKLNRIEEHGGGAVQLSIWGYDAAASGAAFFTTTTCNPTPFSDAASCAAKNGGKACKYFPSSGAQLSNCSTERSCLDWSAAAPWNPIQAQAADCGWNGSTNDVNSVVQTSDGITLAKQEPYHFTKTTAFPGLTFYTTGQVLSDRPYLRLRYRMVYSGPEVGAHNQELPAIFTDNRINHFYYFYEGASAYADVTGTVTRRRADSMNGLNLPGRGTPPAGFETGGTFSSGEEWMAVCDSTETQCLTVASFSPLVKTLVQDQHYVTALGRFALGRSFDETWDLFLFPYRYDQVVAGRSVREWIYALKKGS